MKKNLNVAALTIATLIASVPAYGAAPATVSVINRGGEKIYFQPEAALEYSQVTANDTVITVTDSPAYYRLIAENGNFHPVFITPGSTTEITVGNDGNVAVKGTNEKENSFISSHPYICRTPKTIKPYSSEWIAYNESEILKLDSLIDASGSGICSHPQTL